MHYSEHRPSPALAHFVKCIWTLRGHASELEDKLQPVLPDGHPELVVHFGDAFERIGLPGCVERQPDILFAGQLTNQLLLRPTGQIAVVGMRLRPDAAPALIHVPAHNLVGCTLGIDVLAPGLFHSLCVLRDSAATLDQALVMMQTVVARHLDSTRLDRRVRHAVELIIRSYGNLSIDQVAHGSELTRRHLERRFDALVGISPKRLARIARFQRALRMFEDLRIPSKGTQTAAACGYADQAHFIRECRELAGCSPSAHLLRNAELAGFFTG